MSSRRIRFAPSAHNGQSDTISATQGSVKRGPVTVSSWRNNPEWEGAAGDQDLTLTVDVIVPEGDLYAPVPVIFETSVAGSIHKDRNDVNTDYDPSFGRINYVILTGDTGQWRNDWVAHPSHRNKAFAYGKRCAHVYETPGIHYARVYAYDDNGKWGASDVIKITVLDPDDIPDSQTIVVDQTGNFTDAPSHAVANRCTSLVEARSRFESIKGLGTTRVCLRGGQTFTENLRFTIGEGGRVIFDTFGTGRAIMKAAESDPVDGVTGGGDIFSYNRGYPFTVANWSFELGYNGLTGAPTSGIYIEDRWRRLLRERAYNGPFRFFVHFHNCDIRGVTGTAMEGKTEDLESITVVSDCYWEDGAEFIAFGNSNIYFLGNRITELSGSCLGGLGRNSRGAFHRGAKSHVGIREVRYTQYLRGCYMESRGGWSGQQSSPGGLTGYSTQPLIRIKSNDEEGTRDGTRWHLVGNVFSGNFQVDGAVPINNNVLIENNLFISDPARVAPTVLERVTSRKVLRNNVFLILNMTRRDRPYFRTLGRNQDKFESGSLEFQIGQVERAVEVPGAANNSNVVHDTSAPIVILHNTHANLRISADLPEGFGFRNQDNDADWTLIDGHNIDYGPNLDDPIIPSGGMTKESVAFRILQPWIMHSWEIVLAFDLSVGAPSGVASGEETPPIPYPNDWYNNPTTGADYLGNAGNNWIETSTEGYSEVPWRFGITAPNLGTMTVIHDCNSSGVVQGDGTGTHFKVRNDHPTDTWTGTVVVILDRGGPNVMEPEVFETFSQDDVAVYRPTTAQALDPGVQSCLFDFEFRLRPNAGFSISPTAGDNSAGAHLPA